VAKGEQKGNRETKKPKKEKIKTIAAAPAKMESRQVANRHSNQERRNRKLSSQMLAGVVRTAGRLTGP
jgi:F0F1-type ATP synthase assembly protein I